jgi:hypothetical protein
MERPSSSPAPLPWLRLLAVVTAWVGSSTAAQQGPAQQGPAQQGPAQPTQAEIAAFLESRSLPRSIEDGGAEQGSTEEVPPPPPRHRGMVLEASSGAVFPLGALRHVSPPSPWFQLHLGYEPTSWFMVLLNGDFTLANTSYAARPPEPRTYAHYAVGAGGRFQLQLAEWFGAHGQFELGASEVTEEVLVQYGYTRSDRLSFHYGARLGLEWLQPNPHLAVGLQGTFRNYPGLDRSNDASPPTALMLGATLRYGF